MRQILVLYESVIPTVEMTCQMFEDFSEWYGLKCEKKNILAVTEADINESAVIVSIRGESPLTLGILESAVKSGKYTIFYLDDDLGHISKAAFRNPARKKWLYRCIQSSHMLLTCNKLIADDYVNETILQRYAIIHTDIDEKAINNFEPDNTDTIRIVYPAGESHVVFWDKYINPVLPDLIKLYKEKLHITFIGVHPNIDSSLIQYVTYVPNMKYDEYVGFMRENKFDIGLAPLTKERFSERKYFNKYLEYAKNGICGLYSNCMPYTMVVEDGVNGYLVDEGDWLEKLCAAIDNKEARINCIKNSQAYIRKNHTKDVIYKKLAEDIPELLQDYEGREGNIVKIQYKAIHRLFRIKESVYLTVKSLSKFGLKKTIQRVKRKIS